LAGLWATTLTGFLATTFLGAYFLGVSTFFGASAATATATGAATGATGAATFFSTFFATGLTAFFTSLTTFLTKCNNFTCYWFLNFLSDFFCHFSFFCFVYKPLTYLYH